MPNYGIRVSKDLTEQFQYCKPQGAEAASIDDAKSHGTNNATFFKAPKNESLVFFSAQEYEQNWSSLVWYGSVGKASILYVACLKVSKDGTQEPFIVGRPLFTKRFYDVPARNESGKWTGVMPAPKAVDKFREEIVEKGHNDYLFVTQDLAGKRFNFGDDVKCYKPRFNEASDIIDFVEARGVRQIISVESTEFDDVPGVAYVNDDQAAPQGE